MKLPKTHRKQTYINLRMAKAMVRRGYDVAHTRFEDGEVLRKTDNKLVLCDENSGTGAEVCWTDIEGAYYCNDIDLDWAVYTIDLRIYYIKINNIIKKINWSRRDEHHTHT